MAEAIAEPAAARPVATGFNPWLPATPELDAARARWENLAQTIESRGTESFNASEQKFLKAWRQWEIDSNRKIEAGKKQWDDKFKTFLTSKQTWQEEIKAAAMEQSLEKMLGATGSALNERLKTLSANINIPVDVPEINVANLVQAAMADFERLKPSNERLFGEINKSITAFNVTLELGNATHFKGFNSSTLEGDFASNMETFSKKMAILNNVKMYESFKKLIEDFKESLRKNDKNVTAGLTTAATLANYRQDGGWYTKDMGWAFGGKYGFSAYQHADVDGLMNRGMREAGMTIMSGDEMVSFLEKGRDIDVKLFFEVQTMALEQAFKIVGGDKSKKGLYGEWVGEAPQYNNDGDETNQGSGELGGWAGGQMDNKKTYRGLNKEEKRLGLVQGVWTTAMNITASVVAAASGNIPMMMQIAAAQATATTGTSISQGRDAGGSIAVGLMDFGISVGGAMVGGDWTGAAIRGGAGFVRAGIGQNADGTLNLDFKGNWTKNGAGASAAFSGVMSTLGTGIGDKVGGKLGFAISAGMDAIGDGMRFNGDGSIGGFSAASAIGSLAASGVSYGFNNSTSTSGSHFDGPVVKQMLSSEMGKIAKSVTTTILGSAFNDARAFNSGLNSYQQVNGWSALGGLLGRQLKVGMDARSHQRQAQDGGEGGAAGNFVGGIMAQGARRRRDWLDEIGDVTSDAGSILSDAAKDFGGAIYENALQPIGNTISRIWNGMKNFFSSSDAKLASASGVIPREFDPSESEIIRWQRNSGSTMIDAPIQSVSAYPEEKSIWAKIGGAFSDAASWVGDQIESSYNWIANRGYHTGAALTAIEKNQARMEAEGIEAETAQPDGQGGWKKVTTYKAGGKQEMPISADDAASLAALAPVKGIWTEIKETLIGAWNTLVNREFLPKSLSSSTTKKAVTEIRRAIIPNTLRSARDAAERTTLASQNVTDHDRMMGNFQMMDDAPYAYMCLPYSSADYPNTGIGMLTPEDLMNENAGEFIKDKTGTVSKTNPQHKPGTGIMGALTKAGDGLMKYAQPSLDNLQKLAISEFKSGNTSWLELLSTVTAAVPIGIIYAQEGNIKASTAVGPIKFSAETEKGVLKNWTAETGITIPIDTPGFYDSEINANIKLRENLNSPSGPNSETIWEIKWKARY